MELDRIAELARQDRGRKFHSIAHLLTQEALWEAFDNLRKKAAAGVDGVTYADYAEHLVGNLLKLHEKLKPALRIALLRAAHRALRACECTRDLRLLGESRLDQEHHRVGFGHCVTGAIVVHRQSRDHDHALIFFNTQAAARVDDYGV